MDAETLARPVSTATILEALKTTEPEVAALFEDLIALSSSFASTINEQSQLSTTVANHTFMPGQTA
jgi:hypothetical protein